MLATVFEVLTVIMTGSWLVLVLVFYSIVYYYDGAQRYEHFLLVGQLYQALILLGLALSSECLTAYVSSVFIYIKLYLLVSWAWWDWSLMWLTNHCLSVVWHCWLCHLTRKIVSKMTYNVSCGTSNSTIPYRAVLVWRSQIDQHTADWWHCEFFRSWLSVNLQLINR